MSKKKPKVNKIEQHKKAIIVALEKSLGVVTSACKQVGIGRTTFYNYFNDDKNFRDQVNDISEIAIDFAESQLHKQIQDGNTSATIFYLKTKGKKRGYIERSEIQHDGIVKSTIIEWKPPEQLNKDVTDNSTISLNQKNDLKSTKEEQDQEKQSQSVNI
mgnify:FL=1